ATVPVTGYSWRGRASSRATRIFVPPRAPVAAHANTPPVSAAVTTSTGPVGRRRRSEGSFMAESSSGAALGAGRRGWESPPGVGERRGPAESYGVVSLGATPQPSRDGTGGSA